MTRSISYDQVEIGTEIPAVTKQPTSRQLVKWAAFSGDINEIHYDKDFAVKQGLPGVIIQGSLILSFLAQMLTDWIGEDGILRELACSFRGMNTLGEPITCRGRVTRKFARNGEHCLECEIWAENAKGESTIPGTAVVVLPSMD